LEDCYLDIAKIVYPPELFEAENVTYLLTSIAFLECLRILVRKVKNPQSL
jgi:hypothetical protein